MIWFKQGFLFALGAVAALTIVTGAALAVVAVAVGLFAQRG
jgi:hypothetical protein